MHGFNAAANNCQRNEVSLERPPMCRVMLLWVIIVLPNGPLMWEMFLISISVLVYAFPLHFNTFISFGNPLKIQSHSFQVAWSRAPSASPVPMCGSTSRSSFSHFGPFLSAQLSLPFISELPSAPRAQSSYTFSPSSQRPLVFLQCCGKCFSLLWLGLQFSQDFPVILKSQWAGIFEAIY